ncbi:MAG: helix-turn-helix domain-containing protein [Ignavibacteriaceae bacterium]|nr:helix-turn-helix domain-containing protein [Ignavibacteriaceae bacterium]
MNFTKLSEELKSAREAAGISPEQMASTIKIDPVFLSRMESGDFTFLPDLYVKSFIKEYAKNARLDPSKIIAKYEMLKEGKVPGDYIPHSEQAHQPRQEQSAAPGAESEPVNVKPEPAAKTEPAKVLKEPVQAPVQKVLADDSVLDYSPDTGSRKGFFSKPANIAAVIIGVIIIAAGVFILVNSGGPEPIVVEKPYDEVLEDAAKQRHNEPGNKSGDEIITSGDSLKVTFSAIDSAWIQTTIDAAATDNFLLVPFSSKTLKAKENVRALIGNSYVIKISINDNELTLPAITRNVNTFLISKSGIVLDTLAQ